MPTQVAAPTALLVASRAEQADVAVLLRGLGFNAVQVEGADALNALGEPLSLCLIDLRENGDALRVARAVRAQQPHAIVIGIDPSRATASADAIRAGGSTCCRGRRRRAISKRSSPRARASRSPAAPPDRSSDAPPYDRRHVAVHAHGVDLVQRAAPDAAASSSAANADGCE
jgi:hypothetical protein